MPKLDRRTATNLPGPGGERFDVVHWDDDQPGLGLRILRSGTRNWVVRYRVGTRQRVVTLGRVATLTPTEARSRAREIAAKAKLGHDEQADIQSRKAHADRPKVDTFAEVAEAYLKHVVSHKRPRTQTERKRHLARDWRFLHELSIGEITRRQIAARLLDLRIHHGPIAANRSRGTLNALFVWSMQQGIVETNPVAGTARPAEEVTRDRVLTRDEVKAIWQGTSGVGDYNKIVRLLVLTGQRREEIAAMRWSELDFERSLWTIPSERTKNKRPHDVPLSTQVVGILNDAPERPERDLLFGEGKGAFSGWSQSKQRLDRRSAVSGWTLHDLRRTVVTGMAELGTQPHVIEAVVNHVSGHRAGVAGTYNRAIYATEKRAALEIWADHIEDMVS